MKSRLVWAVIILFVCLWADQVTKKLAHKNLPRHHRISYVDDMVRLQYAENSGAAFSLGSDLPENVRWVIFGFGQGIFLLILAGYLIKTHKQAASQFYGFVLILGGGLGNFLDRIYRDGVVVDFLNVGIGRLRTAIFNVADIAITIGLILLIVGMIIHSNNEKKQKSLDDAENEINNGGIPVPDESL